MFVNKACDSCRMPVFCAIIIVVRLQKVACLVSWLNIVYDGAFQTIVTQSAGKKTNF